jgi:lysine 2,3-aminomutase
MYHGEKPGRAMATKADIQRARPDVAPVWEAADRAFPVRVTQSFWDRIDPDDPDDPLARQVLPHAAELLPDDDDLLDPVGDAACSPVPWVVHKYPDRVLVLVTKRCHLYCRYCFRRDHVPGEAQDPSPEDWEAAWDYVDGCGAEEVILSGGDPLAVNDRRLADALQRARRAAPVVRVHTRAPITFPRRVTPELVELLRQGPTWVVVHCNHPRELSPDVDAALSALVDGGVPVLNQSVLLRGVNDDVEVLAELSRQLVRRRVFPYYLHHPDRARGNAHLRVPMDEALELVEALRRRTSGLGMPRHVVDVPDGSGKIDADRYARREGGA